MSITCTPRRIVPPPRHPVAALFAVALISLATACGPAADGMPAGDPAAYPEQPFAEASVEAGAALAPDTEAPAITSERGSDDGYTELTWDELYELDLDTGEPSPLLAGLDGQPVKIPGFMVPLDDSAASVSEFLLVPYAGACIHVPPPPPNQIVHVTMVDGESSDVYWWDPIWIYGDLEIENVEHAYGQASYRLGGLRTEVYTAAPPAP